MLACNYVPFQCQSESLLSAVAATIVDCRFRYDFTGVATAPAPTPASIPLLVTFWSTFVRALRLQLMSKGCHGVVELVNQARKLPLLWNGGGIGMQERPRLNCQIMGTYYY